MGVPFRPPWKRKKPIRKWWRCADCGKAFASSLPGCAEHPKVLMLEWTPLLAAAFRTQLEHAERGEASEKGDGLYGNTLEVAARLVERWRGVRVEGPQ